MKKTNGFEEQLVLLQNEGLKIEKWLKEANVADERISAVIDHIDGHQCISIDFEYNGNAEYLDVDALATSIAENVIDDRFYVRVSTYNEEEYKNAFCVEVWLDN